MFSLSFIPNPYMIPYKKVNLLELFGVLYVKLA